MRVVWPAHLGRAQFAFPCATTTSMPARQFASCPCAFVGCVEATPASSSLRHSNLNGLCAVQAPFRQQTSSNATALTCTIECSLSPTHTLINISSFSTYSLEKQRENAAALAVLPDLLREVDAQPLPGRLLALVEGVLAANIFDWGSQACVALYKVRNRGARAGHGLM